LKAVEDGALMPKGAAPKEASQSGRAAAPKDSPVNGTSATVFRLMSDT
jgi:hypothetical protein